MNWKEFNEIHDKDTLRSTWYHEKILMPCSKPITFASYRLNITPNTLTALSSLMAVSGMGIVLLNPNSWWAGLVNLVFLQLCYISDISDGKLAKLQGTQTIFGDFFDKILDRLNSFIVLGGFGFAWVMSSDAKPPMSSIAVYVSSASVYILYTIVSATQRFVFPNLKGTMKEYGRNWKEKIIKVPYQFMNMGTHFLLLSISFVFGFIYQMVIFYGILGGSFTVAMIVYLYFKDAEDRALSE